VGLRYECGSEGAPGGRSGRVVLTLDAGGGLRLEAHRGNSCRADDCRADSHRADGCRAWTASVPPSVPARLVEALRLAGFPVPPPADGPAGTPRGAVLCRLDVSGHPAGALVLARPAADRTDYATVLALLDGLVQQVSGGVLRAPGADPGLPVTRAAEASRRC
jgi:hypothetical protein